MQKIGGAEFSAVGGADPHDFKEPNRLSKVAPTSVDPSYRIENERLLLKSLSQ